MVKLYVQIFITETGIREATYPKHKCELYAIFMQFFAVDNSML